MPKTDSVISPGETANIRYTIYEFLILLNMKYFKIIAKVIGSLTESKIASELDKRGVSGFKNWMISFSSTAAIELALETLIKALESESRINFDYPIEVRLSANFEPYVDHYWKKDPDWVYFSNGEAFNEWFSALSSNNQAELLSFLAYWLEEIGEPVLRQA